ncbi:zinc finger CCCH domain-containing protein 29-like [Andrographis paniculata]|uniref:zinc finger CCCH domain-containing protein 29-like n=1 Tax=Andrographis paniculata TaxID=175694 RepID=UPI0021E7E695|nr:zinc finger CCCH domain-containing protein 29-like [Andrographis paniculata]
MEGGKHCSKLLELAAADDLSAFVDQVEKKGSAIDDVSFWYSRSFCSNKMTFQHRTPLMIAALFGSSDVLNYILKSGNVDVNRASATDGATALHCAAAGGSPPSVEISRLLIAASGDVNAVSVGGKKPADLIPPAVRSSPGPKRRALELLLNGRAGPPESETPAPAKREYLTDVALPDINAGIYSSDEFRMYNFKVNPCSRAYPHDWTDCPFVHPGENARRRDPRKYTYTCVPCPEFKKSGGACGKADACEYAHGVFESWLHPAQYRTRLCKDDAACARKVCFFAHKPAELRPLYAATGSAISDDLTTPISPPLHFPAGRRPKAARPPVIEETASLSNLDDIFPVRQLRASYPSPTMNRSQSFADRSPATYRTAGNYPGVIGSKLAEWSSPDGKVDWGFNDEVASKLRKSMSFGIRSGNVAPAVAVAPPGGDRGRWPVGGGARWIEQMYIEQEQMVA